MTVLLLELVVVLVVLALVLVVPQLLLAGLDRGCSDCFQNGPPSRFSQAVFFFWIPSEVRAMRNSACSSRQ